MADRAEPIQDESEETLDRLQAFLSTVHALAEQRRLGAYTFPGRRIDL